MPELAEVEYYRKTWDKGLRGKILSVQLNAGKRVFLGTDSAELRKTLAGSTLLGSEAHGKQMLFRFSSGGWMGVHLGMSGELRVETAGGRPLKHDHLILRQEKQNLVFNDARQLGRVRFFVGENAPPWWTDRPPRILSAGFSLNRVEKFLARRKGAPIKAVLLMQEGFPGIGNWMADEILWQARIHPARRAGQLRPAEIKELRDKILFVTRGALRTAGKHGGDPPKAWLFHERWGAGGHCPRDGAELRRAQIGGRTTCWCPICQKARRGV